MGNEFLLEMLLKLHAIKLAIINWLEVLANVFAIVTGCGFGYGFYLEFFAGVVCCGQITTVPNLRLRLRVYLHNNSLREKDIESIEVRINEVKNNDVILAENVKIPPRTTQLFEIEIGRPESFKIDDDPFNYRATRIRIKFRNQKDPIVPKYCVIKTPQYSTLN
jgi:hypothetical protein